MSGTRRSQPFQTAKRCPCGRVDQHLTRELPSLFDKFQHAAFMTCQLYADSYFVGFRIGAGGGQGSQVDACRGALRNQGGIFGLKPPASSSDRAMWWVRFRKPGAVPRRCSNRPLMASVGPFEDPGRSKNARMSATLCFNVRPRRWISVKRFGTPWLVDSIIASVIAFPVFLSGVAVGVDDPLVDAPGRLHLDTPSRSQTCAGHQSAPAFLRQGRRCSRCAGLSRLLHLVWVIPSAVVLSAPPWLLAQYGMCYSNCGSDFGDLGTSALPEAHFFFLISFGVSCLILRFAPWSTDRRLRQGVAIGSVAYVALATVAIGLLWRFS